MNPIPQPQPQTAYLHLLVDVRVEPPVVVSAGAYSEPVPTTIYPGFIWAKIGELTRSTFGEAREALIENAMIVHGAWIGPLLDKPVQG